MNEATWAAVGLAVVTMLGNSVSAVLSYLRGRDTLTQDVKVALLEQEKKTCEQNLVEIKVDLAKCHEQHEAADADRKQLRMEVNEIKKTLAKAASAS